METAEVRQRLKNAIARAKTEAQERRVRNDESARAYETFLAEHAVPLFHTFANALNGEGLRYKVFTPAGSVRLASESGAEDYIELTLDDTGDSPQVLGRSSRGRGRRSVTSERPLKPGGDIGSLTQEDVLQYLLDEIKPFVTGS